jgi:hypothetical protein
MPASGIEDDARGYSSPPLPQPSFDLVVGAGEARLSLARSLDVSLGIVRRLELRFRAGSSLDLREGAVQFRDRAGTSPSGELFVPFDRITSRAASRGLAVALAADTDLLRVTFDDGRAPRTCEGRLETRGDDLWFVPRSDDAPLDAWAEAFGLRRDGRALIFFRGFRRILVEALASRGWRAPVVVATVDTHVGPSGVRFVWDRSQETK